MPCETEMWQHAKNVTSACAHPAIVHCLECRAGICSAHIIECEVCEMFICSDCEPEHQRNHEKLQRQVGELIYDLTNCRA
jgi:predicted sulfurtransferase